MLCNEEMRREILSRLSGYRLKHTLGCEKAARKLAKKFGEDEEKCAFAMLLHGGCCFLGFTICFATYGGSAGVVILPCIYMVADGIDRGCLLLDCDSGVQKRDVH